MATMGGFSIKVVHKPGTELIFADALSRAHQSRAMAQLAAEQCASMNLSRIRVKHSESQFSQDL